MVYITHVRRISLGIVIFAVILIGIYILKILRERQIEMEDYVQETQQFIVHNRSELDFIFTTLFDQIDRCHKNAEINLSDCDQFNISNFDIFRFSESMRNMNDTYFAKLFYSAEPDAQYAIYTLYMDGRSGINYASPIIDLLREFNPTPVSLWFDDSHSLHGREIVIPYTINGKVVGAIVRTAK